MGEFIITFTLSLSHIRVEVGEIMHKFFNTLNLFYIKQLYRFGHGHIFSVISFKGALAYLSWCDARERLS